VSGSSLSPEEIRAAAETHRELGPDYQSAVVDSFLDRVGREVDARVDARVAATRGLPHMQPVPPPKHSQVTVIALGSMVLGIPISAIAAAAGSHPAGIWGLLIVWIAIAAINMAYAFKLRQPPDRR
jgi:hypothetical protein